jgi:hypothetical protein
MRKRVSVKVNVAQNGEVRGGRLATNASVPPDSYQYVAPKTTVDLYFEYRFWRNLTLHGNVSNLTGEAKRTWRYGPSTPDYAKEFRVQDIGAQVTLGLKAEF